MRRVLDYTLEKRLSAEAIPNHVSFGGQDIDCKTLGAIFSLEACFNLRVSLSLLET